jgi:hypothetical protein
MSSIKKTKVAMKQSLKKKNNGATTHDPNKLAFTDLVCLRNRNRAATKPDIITKFAFHRPIDLSRFRHARVH